MVTVLADGIMEVGGATSATFSVMSCSIQACWAGVKDGAASCCSSLDNLTHSTRSQWIEQPTVVQTSSHGLGASCVCMT